MGFLSQNTIAKIRGAVKKTTDTFLQKDAVYRLKTQTVQRWGEGEGEATAYAVYNLKALYVESDNDSDIIMQKQIGNYNEAFGYFLFNFDDLDAIGLVQNGQPVMNPNTDLITCDSVEYEVLGVHPLGQLVDRFTVVKVIVKKTIRDI